MIRELCYTMCFLIQGNVVQDVSSALIVGRWYVQKGDAPPQIQSTTVLGEDNTPADFERKKLVWWAANRGLSKEDAKA